MSGVRIELDVADGFYYVRKKVGSQWKASSRHVTMLEALNHLIEEEKKNANNSR